jgi:hypothetical protein
MRFDDSNLKNSSLNLIQIRGDLVPPNWVSHIERVTGIVSVGFFGGSEVDLKGCHPALNQWNLTSATSLQLTDIQWSPDLIGI